MNTISQNYDNQIKDIIFRHLDPKDYQVFLFGSRASQTNSTYSDYDIGIMGKNSLPATIKADIEDELEQSNIPFIVEIVDFHHVSNIFKKTALKEAILWTP